jgi:hypothetical protein
VDKRSELVGHRTVWLEVGMIEVMPSRYSSHRRRVRTRQNSGSIEAFVVLSLLRCVTFSDLATLGAAG